MELEPEQVFGPALALLELEQTLLRTDLALLRPELALLRPELDLLRPELANLEAGAGFKSRLVVVYYIFI